MNTNNCSNCGLTVSYSYININSQNQCKFCQKHKDKIFLGKEKLIQDVNLQPNEKIGVTVSGGKDSIYMWGVLTELFGAEHILALSYYKPGITNEIAMNNMKKTNKILGTELYIHTDNTAYERFRKNFEILLSNPKPEAIRILLCAGCRYGVTELLYQIGQKQNIKKYFSGASYLELAPFKEELIMARSATYDLDDGFNNIIADYPNLNYDDNLMIILRDNKYKYKNNETGQSQLKVSPDIKLFDFDLYFENNPIKIEHLIKEKYGWEKDNRSWHFDCIIEDVKDVFYYGLLGYTEMDFHTASLVRYGIITQNEANKIIHEFNNNIANSYPKMIEFLKKHNLEHLTPKLNAFYSKSQYLIFNN